MKQILNDWKIGSMIQQFDTFDDWFHQIENFGTRAERFYESMSAFTSLDGQAVNAVMWLKAAFEAARAEPQKIGITGTREGMNAYQQAAVRSFLLEMYAYGKEFHHGDCIGVDAEAAAIAADIGYKIVSYPGPDEGGLRAYFKSDEIREPKSHFARNRDIVDFTDILMVVPLQDSHQTKGGTWYTHDYAMKKGKKVQMFYPSAIQLNFGDWR